jgi:hypothetical protein
MAHYAKLDENNIVLEVIVIADRNCLDENGNVCEENGRKMCEALTRHANWKKTSYNTRMGVHYDSNTGEPSTDQSKAFRLNFAQLKMKYDENLNGFVHTHKQTPFHFLNTQTGHYELNRSLVPSYPENLLLDQYPVEEYFEVWFWNTLTNQWVKIRRDEPIPIHVIIPEILGYDSNFVGGIASE